MPTGVSRFLSRREKKAKALVLKPHDGRRDIYRLFHWTENRKTTREEDKSIAEITKKLDAAEINDIQQSHIEYAIRWTGGHTEIAHELCVLLHDTSAGDLRPVNPDVEMIGAENREYVTCYIDSLLFAMFARMDSFESILSVEFPDHATNTLAHALRYWVNMLRSGRLITTDITKFIQESLADCGWKDASHLVQQDVSEAFTFITDKLALPLLTLKMDVYHTGKDDLDDHKIVKERLLEVALPDPPEDAPESGYTIKLEDCLENYFNNQIEVKRHLQRRNTVNYGQKPRSPKLMEIRERESGERSESRAMSIFRHRAVSKDDDSAILEDREVTNSITQDDIDVHPGRKSSTGSAVFRKEVLMPAWQFFHLIPWSTNKNKPDADITTDAQVAAHFATKKPVLGICLKRYTSYGEGHFKRLNTYVDIPLEIKLPHFISDGTEDDGFGSSFTRFKLSLQSVICHRGVVLEMGHYVSLVRPSSEEAMAEYEEGQPDPKYQWFLHDDLAKGERVTRVDIRKALKDETPYLVFYQVQPIDDFDELDEYPPTYAEATGAHPTPPAGSSTTISMPSSASFSTVIGTESSSPPLVAVGSNLSDPNATLPPVVPISLPTPITHSVVEAAVGSSKTVIISTTSSKGTTSSVPTHIDISTLTSSLNHVDGASLLQVPQQLQTTVSGHESHSSDTQDHHSFTTSVASTIPSIPSGQVSPGEEGGKQLEEESSVVDTSSPQELPGHDAETSISRSNSLNKRSWLRRNKEEPDNKSKEKDAVDTSGALTKDKRYNSRSWLGGSTKSRSRPVSEANGNTSNFVRGLREVMSRDKLAPTFHTGGPDEQQTDESTHGDASPVDSAAPSFTFAVGGHNRERSDLGREKDKERDKLPVRKKSNSKKKSKAKKDKDGANGVNGVGVEGGVPTADGGSEDGNSDRQCMLM